MPMATFENLDGEKLLAVFKQLVRQQILIKVYLPRVGYENLTIVTDTVFDSRQQLFQIDAPEGLRAAIDESGSDQLLFEFTSDDKVIHRFKSEIATIRGKTLSLRYPLIIQRHQQRDNFRIKASMDSHAIASLGNSKVRMEIDNISLGGMYCFCPNGFKANMPQGLELTDMQLTFTLRNQCACVSVHKATIKRVESVNRPRRFGIAMEFKKLDRNNKKLLIQLIYDLQRLYLQNRTKKI
jgi:c-di-GMP-binding flagellar brake protein YcgR